jgi:menaquinone-dependent protoporphyrinogen IX oxidase
MIGRMLIAHATKHGSTIDVADAIASALRDCGHDVDVEPAAGAENGASLTRHD